MSSSERRAARPTARVLLVEAEERRATALAEALRERGLAVQVATTLGEAAERLRNEGFDATLLAHPLPGVDRVAACAALRPGPEAPPLLLLDATGDADEVERVLPQAMRPVAVLPRPADPEKLVQAVRALLLAPDPQPDQEAPADPSFPELLVRLRREGETGTLEIRAEGVCTTLYLDRGTPVFAEGGRLRETLGRMLLRHGTLSEADYVRVIERMTESRIGQEPLRMGEALVELGLLGPAQVYEALLDQVREKIVGCFLWSRFSAAFYPMDALPEGLAPFEVPSLEAILLEGLRTHFDAARLDRLLAPHGANRPGPPEDTEALVRRFQMSGPEQRVLRALDGRRSVAELCTEGEAGERAKPLLAALLVTGSLYAAEASAAPRPIHRARPATARPAAAGPRASAPPADEARQRLDAEKAFRAGHAAFAAERFEQAHRAFAEAARLQPKEPEYAMYEAWSGYLARRVELTVARAKARACAMRMAQLEPGSARPHSILGRLAADERRFDTAAKEFEAALVRDPADRDASAGLRHLEGEGFRRRSGPGS